MASTGVTIVEITGLVAQLGGLAILAGTIAAGVAAVFRWYADGPLPRGLALLAGLSGVALYLNTTSALAEVITRQSGPTATQVALFNITAFAVGAAGAELGRRVGDRFETDVFLRAGSADTDDDVGRLGRALGRVVEVQLPPEVEDVVGYDPVEERTKENLAGQTFLFPRGLDVEELESRLVSRLKSDYGVGTVDVDLAADGTVEHLGVGRRAAGIGPTLPPATNAVAVQADPPFAASAGDLVQLWETQPARRVLTGELRGVAGDTVTLAIDAADTPKVDPGATYRLVTLPVEDRPDREFASLLRAADETYTSVTVAERSPIAGVPVGALSVSIAAMADEEGETTAIPTQDAVIEPGTVLFAIGTPDRLRRLEVAATALSEGVESTRRASPSSVSADASGSAAAGASDRRDRGAGDSQGTPAEETAAPAAGTAADSEATPERESAAESGTPADSEESAGAVSEASGAGRGPGQPEAAGAGVNRQGDEEAEDGGASDDETAAASDEKPVTDEATPGAIPEGSEAGSTPPSFDELADAVGEDRSDDPPPDDDAESGGSGPDPDGPAAGSSGSAEPEDADADDADTDDDTDADDTDADDADTDDDTDTDDDLSALSFADDASGDDLDDLGDLSVGEDVDAGDDDLGDFEDLAFGKDGAADAEQDDSEETEEDEDGTADDGEDGGDDDESDDGGDDDESDDGGDDDESDDGGHENESDDGESDDDESVDDEVSDSGDDENDDESNDDGGGGGGTFAQLKEEFESGDADWADEIDDSPGGDMRLDE